MFKGNLSTECYLQVSNREVFTSSKFERIKE